MIYQNISISVLDFAEKEETLPPTTSTGTLLLQMSLAQADQIWCDS
jgi:hypothetical protein